MTHTQTYIGVPGFRPSSRRVISAGSVITGRPNEVVADAAVAIEDKTIVWVGSSQRLPDQYAAWEHLEFPGSTILPGLIETHAHFGAREGSRPQVPAPEVHDQGWNAFHSLLWARRLASVGVTSVQSLGSTFYTDVALREAIGQELVSGPRIVAAGPMITTTGGHDWRGGGEVDSIDDIRHAVREHHKAGVDVIKVGATGGFFTPGSAQWKAQFTVEELTALVEDAHRLGHRVAAHAHGTEGIRRAVDAGVDYIAHGTFISDDGTTRFEPELARRIAERGIFVDVAAPPSFPVVPGETIAPRARELYESGVKIVTGHDIGAVIPPEAYLFGLYQLEKAGIPRSEILIAATSRAAAAIGLSGVTGVLAPQYDADLLVVDGNPLDDLTALERKRLIVIQGKDFNPDYVPEYHGKETKGDRRNSTANVLQRHFERLERAKTQQW